MKKENVVVLNSGGFDSVILMNILGRNESLNITSLFFNYGQRNLNEEEVKAKNIASKFEAKHIEIKLPNVTWSRSSVLDADNKDCSLKGQYIEMRNLIMFSYALSLAEGIGATKVFSAILKHAEGGYVDTTPKFISDMQNVYSLTGVELVTPMTELEKMDLIPMIRKFKIDRGDFFSCNNPTNSGESCGKCGDCLVLDAMYRDLFEATIPVQSWIFNDFKYSRGFDKLFKDSPINEVRLLTNNKCQFKCKHCFYGFEEMKGEMMSIDNFKKVIDDSIEIGVTNFHFSGKEPLFDESIFELAEYISSKRLGVTCDVVSNGVNVVKYLDKIVESGINKVFLSVDSVKSEVRNNDSFKYITNSLKALEDTGLDVEIFIDVHKDNHYEIVDIIKYLSDNFKGISSYYIRNIKPLGNSIKENMEYISFDEYEDVYYNVINNLSHLDITFSVSKEYTKHYLEVRKDSSINEDILDVFSTSNSTVIGDFKLLPEVYCSPFENTITVTPDGYVLGCATEVSSPNYDELSAGNILDDSLAEIVSIGKDLTLKRLKEDKCSECSEGCYHTPYKLG